MRIFSYLIHIIGLFIGCIFFSEQPDISLFNIIFNSLMIAYYLVLEIKERKI